MRPAEGIIDILADAGIGAVPPTSDPWPIYEGTFPTDKEQCILVRGVGGLRPEVRIAIDYPAVQVLTRGSKAGYVAAADKIDEVKLALHAIPSAPTPFPDLTSCLLAGEPSFTGRDELERPIWSANFNCILSKDPEGYRDL